MLADHAVSLSSPTREPQRGLLLFVAIHVERWSAVLDICQAVNAKSATDATEAQLVASAVPLINKYIEDAASSAISEQDTLRRVVIQHAREVLRSQTIPDNRCADQVLARLSGSEANVRSLIEARYRDNYAIEGLTDIIGVPMTEVPGALCHARSLLDWYKDPGEWIVFTADHSISSLMELYLSERIDSESRDLLTTYLTRDISLLARFERQVRLHLILTAVYAPIEVPRNHINRRLVVDTKRLGKPLGSSGRTPVRHADPSGEIATLETHQIPERHRAPLFIAGGIVVMALALSLWLLTTNKTPAPVLAAAQQTTEVSRISSASGAVVVLRAGEKLRAIRGDTVLWGDGFITETAANLVCETATGIRLELGESTKILSHDNNQGNCVIQLEQGALTVSDRGGVTGGGVSIKTPFGQISLKGGQSVVMVSHGRTEVFAERGQALFSKSDGTEEVSVLSSRRARSRASGGPLVLSPPEFLRGVNLGGNDVVIQGNNWLSQRKAVNAGFSLKGNIEVELSDKKTKKKADDGAEMALMLNSNVWAKDSLTLTQVVPNGEMEVTLWIVGVETLSVVQLAVGEQTLAMAPVSLGGGAWRVGPIPAEISNRQCVVTVKSGLKVAGIQYQALSPPSTPMPLSVALRGDPSSMTHYIGQEVLLEVDIDGDAALLKRIEYVVAGAVVGASTTAPFRAKWTPEIDGSFQLSIRSTDITDAEYETTTLPLRVHRSYGSGEITREIWHGPQEQPLKEFDRAAILRRMPNKKEFIKSLSTSKYGDNYLQRISGYIISPLTGEYVFKIASDGGSELWLKKSGEELERIATLYDKNGVRVNEWDRMPTQTSKPIKLTAGKRHYFEVWHKELSGDDHVEVGWVTPKGEFEAPISGIHCQPNYWTLMPVAKALPPPPSVPSDEARFFQGINFAGPTVISQTTTWTGQKELEKITGEAQLDVWLGSLPWQYASNGLGPLEINRTNGRMRSEDGGRLTIGEESFQNGLGMHAPAEVIYHLGGQYERFQAKVGVNALVKDSADIRVRVEIDGTERFKSGVMRFAQPARTIDIDVRGGEQMRLFVETVNDSSFQSSTDWGEARLLRSAATLVVREGIPGLSQTTPKPTIEVGIKNLLSTGIKTSDKGIDFGIRVTDGIYYLYAWTMENNATQSLPFELRLEGLPTNALIGGLPSGGWQRQGPFAVRVSDGDLRVQIPAAASNAQLMGLEIWQDTEAVKTAPAPMGKNNFSVTLYDAKSQMPVAAHSPMANHAVLSISKLPSPLINFLINTPEHVICVKTELPNCGLGAELVERTPPFTLGDDKGLMRAWEIKPGDYRLTVMGYADTNMKKLVGTYELHFTVVE